jgi:hypothetical protein
VHGRKDLLDVGLQQVAAALDAVDVVKAMLVVTSVVKRSKSPLKSQVGCPSARDHTP